MPSYHLFFIRLLSVFCFLVLLVSCTSSTQKNFDRLYGKPLEPQNRLVDANSEQGQYYLNQVKPIIENRCAVCHGCYDAPCQLKLTSPAGIERGASPSLIYNPARFIEDKPQRLGIDAQTASEWRKQDFHPVLNEREQSSAANLHANLMFRLLTQKLQHPLPDNKHLPNSFDLSLNRKQSCPKIEDIDSYQKKTPLWGMPYALPALSSQELNILSEWLVAGAKMAVDNSPLVPLQSQIKQWETFLNQDSLQHQLVARYIYEHWFLAALYFDEVNSERFFHLVRSATPPGEPVKLIASRRPFDDPGVERVYYRFVGAEEVVLQKTHMPYALNQKRLQRIHELFFSEILTLESLPSYHHKQAANPFITFADLPAQSRYKFMLDEAQYTIMGFIKGPVCRGNVALNVINDQFWVFFVDPDHPLAESDDFIASQVENINFPAENQGIFENLLFWTRYSKHQTQYLLAKSEALEKRFHDDAIKLDEKLIWNGDNHNDNAALTVFRHFDSASVLKGLLGEKPQTAWLIDYTLLERIHYLLVAGFDVYGNLNHQLLTRLHMDFLRLEGEFNFLSLLPDDERLRLRDLWYRDASSKVKEFIYGSKAYLNYPTSISYQSDKPGLELLDIIQQRLSTVISQEHSINNLQVPETHRQTLKSLQEIQGGSASLLPEVSLLLVQQENGSEHIYTITSNRAYSNLTSLFAEQKNRLPEEDTLSVIYGVAGAYPSVFLSAKEAQLPDLVKQIKALNDEASYEAFLDDYGIRRTDKNFWLFSDAFHQQFKQQEPLNYGLLDYNRLENR